MQRSSSIKGNERDLESRLVEALDKLDKLPRRTPAPQVSNQEADSNSLCLSVQGLHGVSDHITAIVSVRFFESWFLRMTAK